jgi:2-C-methyl-D-erythritol 4-phosphate cytidylyltransferase
MQTETPQLSSVTDADKQSYWAIIPAAGVGKRMQADRPKQYLSLGNKTVLEHTLDRLLSMPAISGAVVAISEGDEYWPALNYQSDKPLLIARGGKERSDSVLNALQLLQQQAGKQTVWVLVHDAARPCVRTADIQRLIEQASTEQGGLLALPVRDTMKRAGPADAIDHTVEREGLWHALTPQMFRLDLLLAALLQAQQQHLSITDDASAMELAGYAPQLIEAHEDNIKITRAFDLQLAQLYLQQQQL